MVTVLPLTTMCSENHSLSLTIGLITSAPVAPSVTVGLAVFSRAIQPVRSLPLKREIQPSWAQARAAIAKNMQSVARFIAPSISGGGSGCRLASPLYNPGHGNGRRQDG